MAQSNIKNQLMTPIWINIHNKNYQPKIGFILFCKDNEKLLKEAVTKIFEQGVNDIELIQNKIKDLKKIYAINLVGFFTTEINFINLKFVFFNFIFI